MMEAIYELVIALIPIVALVMIVGLIRPSLVIHWGEKRTRGRVLLYYGIGIFVLSILGDEAMPDAVREEQQQARLERERQQQQARLEQERQQQQARLERERQQEAARLERERKRQHVQAPLLHQEYEENEVSADNRYKGKLLRVYGVVDKVSKDAIGSGMIVYLRADEYGFDEVACRFSKDHEKELARLSVGQEVSIDGTCSGLTLGTVYLRECTIFK